MEIFSWSAAQEIKAILSLESGIKIYNKYINKTEKIILGYGAYQHTKTEFLKTSFSCPSMGNAL